LIFLVLVADLVDLVEAARLEEEVARLARDHRHAPADDRGSGGVDEQQRVGDQEADRADQVQALVDAALVVEAMVVVALLGHKVQEGIQGGSSRRLRRRPKGRHARRDGATPA
jgi:hypothetical protein